ncbi:epimerase family protein SDR39U1-like [Dendronephthya gigantea]|uniref:epimerase family protein SDR39U1-like n=1 Tax=Dendronephthya gigantea TaxID=151771 RepID=UPI00106ADD6A|nr:epimerase family protein SDR39U1-like [Dendronephthya gigantea]
MAARKVLVGGGNGFIGSALCSALRKRGYEVILLSRTPGHAKITWSDLKRNNELPECDAVINLAGENISNPLKRWNEDFKALIRQSRVETNDILTELIKKAAKPPNVWISSSAIGFYPTSETAEYTEDAPPEPEHDFFTKICCDWEDSAVLPSDHPSRHVTLRIGLVLGRDGGAFKSLVWPFWFGVGGVIGSGKQIMSWIHIADMVGILIHALENNNVHGILNATAPQPVSNSEFTTELASALWRPAIIPVPAFAVNMIYGHERALLLLEGQKVIPKRTIESGYSFLFPDIKSCLLNIVK